MLLAGTFFARVRVHGQRDSSAFCNYIWGKWRWLCVNEEWRYASTPAMWLSETAVLTLLWPPAQFCDEILLLEDCAWRPALEQGLEQEGSGCLRRSLAEISALLAKTRYLLMLWFWALISLTVCWFLFFIRPPWAFLYDPNPYYFSPVCQGPNLPRRTHHLDLPNFSSSVRVEWVGRTLCQSFFQSHWTMRNSSFGSQSCWGHWPEARQEKLSRT